MDAPEISDLLVAYDPDTLARLPVRRSDVVERLRAAGRPGVARIAARPPARDDLLDEAAVDALLLRVHAALERLSEEFGQGERVRSVLAPLLDALRAAGAPRPLRVVDVGCGLGYVVRWLATAGPCPSSLRKHGFQTDPRRARRRPAAGRSATGQPTRHDGAEIGARAHAALRRAACTLPCASPGRARRSCGFVAARLRDAAAGRHHASWLGFTQQSHARPTENP